MALARSGRGLDQNSQEREDYILSRIPDFLGVEGNVPFPTFLKEKGIRCPDPYYHCGERLYLCEQPFGISENFSKYDGKIHQINALKFKSLSTHKIVNVDIRCLIKWRKGSDDKIYNTNGAINNHLRSYFRSGVPYVTLREMIMEAIRYIGKEHIYFEYNTATLLYDCHFAKNVNHLQR